MAAMAAARFAPPAAVPPITTVCGIVRVVPGKKLRSMKVGGVFKVGDTVALLDALENSFGIYAKHITDDIIYLVDEKN